VGGGGTDKAGSGLDQVVIHRIARGGHSSGNLDFAIDRGQVVVDGAGTDDQLFGDLRIGQSSGQQAQHLDLAGGQTVGIGRW
jgi:hypothetical protein